jgi:hypothetical protein
MKTPFLPDAGKIAARMLAQATADGRYSEQWFTVCHGCRQWVSSIYHTTFDHKRLCGPCADLVGEGPRSFEAKRNPQPILV